MYKLKEIPKIDRPRERLINFGAESLSNEELLSILLKTGTKDVSVKELASTILNKIGEINKLNEINYHVKYFANFYFLNIQNQYLNFLKHFQKTT